jgi:protein tyrosine phosphatase (PTP) superfamily phosphohydrolase (DUF442 family)
VHPFPLFIQQKIMTSFHRLLSNFAVFAFASVGLAAQAQTSRGMQNVVEITPQLTTSGQPNAEALGTLRDQGYEAVIYLAPPTVGDAVREEAYIIGRQGLIFVNIPIKFDNPTEKDFEAFVAVLNALAGKKVLVHCQVNMRASSMVFLYRTIVGKESPDNAYKAVTKIWVPHGPWKKLILEQLQKNKISYDPF